MKVSLDELRRSAGASGPRATMLAAIDAVAARQGEDLAEIAAVLFGAYITLCCASGHADKLLNEAAIGIEVARREIAAAADTGRSGGGN